MKKNEKMTKEILTEKIVTRGRCPCIILMPLRSYVGSLMVGCDQQCENGFGRSYPRNHHRGQSAERCRYGDCLHWDSLPWEIVQSAVQENVDVIGVSSLGGAHLTLGQPLLDIAQQERSTESVVFVIGGLFPPYDTLGLKEIGYDDIFTPGATKKEIISSIKELVKKKRI